MKFKVLGRLEVESDGRQLDPGAPKQRLLLAMLLCRLGDTASVSELTEALWGPTPPKSASDNLRLYVHRLRKVVGDAAIVTHARPTARYGLRIDPSRLDTHDFGGLVNRAQTAERAGDLQQASRCLDDALALWRGRPFEDLPDEPALAAESAKLEEQRLGVVEHRIELQIRLGRHADVLAELAMLARRHPGRERFCVQLMLALYRAGRPSDALDAYRHTRAFLTDELGLDPTPELRRLHQAVLRQDPVLHQPASLRGPGQPVAATVATGPTSSPTYAPPAALPPAVPRFTGRHAELATLAKLAVARPGAQATPVVAIVGPAGVGKTALAVRWARSVAARFPDGQLFVDLHGFHPGPALTPLTALRHLLHVLGVETAHVPDNVTDATSMYRTRVAGRRLLVLLDNAASSEQVRHLVPGDPHCAAVVTSRDRLSGLVVRDGADRLPLAALPPEHAAALLVRLIEDRGVDADGESLTRLAHACGNLPLALRIAAANLLEYPDRSVTSYLDELARSPSTTLFVDGDEQAGVRGALDLSYRRLDTAARHLFRLLSFLPGPVFNMDTAVAVAGTSPDAAGQGLRQLTAVHLVERHPRHHFGMHHLVRDYARHIALEHRSTVTQQAGTPVTR